RRSAPPRRTGRPRRTISATCRVCGTWTTVSRASSEPCLTGHSAIGLRSEEHTSELQSQSNLVCRLLLEKKKKKKQKKLTTHKNKKKKKQTKKHHYLIYNTQFCIYVNLNITTLNTPYITYRYYLYMSHHI